MFSLAVFFRSFEPLLWAARYTVLISGMGIALGLALGALVCAARLSPSRPLQTLAAVWISFLRGVPLLVQLLVFYYALPLIGVDMPPLAAAVFTIGICASAYIAEIWRGAIAALPKGQVESAVAIGMRRRDVWRRIVLPQAASLSLPALVNELILLVKASSLVSVVGILELTRASQAQAATTFRPLEVYLAAGCIYLAINLFLAALGRALEARAAV